VTVTTPIQGTVCNPNAEPSPDKQVHKIEISSFSHSGDILGGTENLNRSRDHNHALFGVTFHSFVKTWYSPSVTKFGSSSFSHSWDMDWAPNLNWITWHNHAPFRDGLWSLYAGTNYDLPVYQIWNLYVHSLQRYGKWRKNATILVVWGLWVTQGHRQHSHLIERIRLPFRLY